MIKKLQARGEARKGRGFGFVTLSSEEQQQKAAPAEMVRACLDSGLQWNAWEAEFLNDLQVRWKFSPKQLAVLERLYVQAVARAGW